MVLDIVYKEPIGVSEKYYSIASNCKTFTSILGYRNLQTLGER